jgi:hypothetical protein
MRPSLLTSETETYFNQVNTHYKEGIEVMTTPRSIFSQARG